MPCVTLTVSAGVPDIRITDIKVSKTSVVAGETISVTVTLQNFGTLAGQATWALTWDGTEYNRFTSVRIDPGKTATQTESFTIPPTPGSHSLCAEVVAQSW